MTKDSVNRLIQRAISDAAFRRELQRDPARALAGFDLTADERAAVISGDPARLTSLGVDQRMSKAFSLGGDSVASMQVSAGDVASTGGAALIDEGVAATPHALLGDTAAGGHMSLDPGGASGLGSGLATGGAGDTSAALIADPSGTAASVDAGGDVGFDSGIIGDPGQTGSAFEVGGAASGGAALDPGQLMGNEAALDPGSTDTSSALDAGDGGAAGGGGPHEM